MKIFFVVPSLKSGGLERVASLLSSEWATRSGFEVHLISLDSKLPFYPLHKKVRLKQAPIKFDEAGRWCKALKLRFWLRKQAKAVNPDIILSFGEGYNAFVAASLSFLKKPIFLSNRTTPVTSLVGFRGVINPVFYKRANRVFVQTSKSIEILSAKYKGTDFEVIPNPIKEISTTPNYSKKTILNVGSLGGKKNQLGLIRVFSRLSTEFPDWKLIFAGEGPDRFQLESYVQENDLQSQVHFLGTVKDLEQLYKEASIFAFSSLLEGFPNALGEGMRAGMAVIAYDCLTGPSEMISDGLNGYLVEMENELDFQNRLFALMSDIVLRESFGQAARKSMESFNIEHIADLYLKYFSEAFNRN